MQYLPDVTIFISKIERSDRQISFDFQVVTRTILPRPERAWARENVGGEGVPKTCRHAHATTCNLPNARHERFPQGRAKHRRWRRSTCAFVWPETDHFGIMRRDANGMTQAAPCAQCRSGIVPSPRHHRHFGKRKIALHSVWTSKRGTVQGLWRERRTPYRLFARLALGLLFVGWATLGNALAQPPQPQPQSSQSPQPPQASAALNARDANVRQVVLGIISFTRWPTSPAKVRLCVSGNTDYAGDLLAGPLPSTGLPVEAQRVSVDEPAIGALCDALYLGAVSDTERRQLLANIAGHPLLTISERNDSCTLGMMFCLNVDADRVTFDINLDTVARSGVRVHPNVLKLARKPGTP